MGIVSNQNVGDSQCTVVLWSSKREHVGEGMHALDVGVHDGAWLGEVCVLACTTSAADLHQMQQPRAVIQHAQAWDRWLVLLVAATPPSVRSDQHQIFFFLSTVFDNFFFNNVLWCLPFFFME